VAEIRPSDCPGVTGPNAQHCPPGPVACTGKHRSWGWPGHHQRDRRSHRDRQSQPGPPRRRHAASAAQVR